MTFAGGLATEGFKPFAAIYSTFLQRAYDQVVHDIAIQRLPVRFAIDRAGLVGADGPTHAGAFDVAYLGCLPGFVLMAAADEAELVHMVATASGHRRPAVGAALSARRRPRRADAGGGRAAGDRQGPHRARRPQSGAALLRRAAGRMPEGGRRARRAGPVDHGGRCALCQAARHRPAAAAGARARGAGHHRGRRDRRLRLAMCCRRWPRTACSTAGCKVRCMVLPDVFIDQDTPAAMYAKAGLDASGIVAKVFEALGKDVRGRDGEAGVGWPRCQRKKIASIACWSSAACSRAAPRRRPRSRPGWSPPTRRRCARPRKKSRSMRNCARRRRILMCRAAA